MRPGRGRLRLVAAEGHGADLETLLAESGRANREAFAALYDELAASAYGLARSIVRDAQLAADVTQDAFVDIWRHAPRFDAGRGSARSWALAIVHRRAVDAVRREHREHRRAERAAGSTISDHDVEAEALDKVSRDAAKRDAAGLLDALTDAQREAVVLAYFDGRTHTEIAQAVGAPLGTVKTRLRDAMIKLRDVAERSRTGTSRVGRDR